MINPHGNWPKIKASLFAFSSIALTSCMVGPNFAPPCPPETESYNDVPIPDKTASSKNHGGKSQQFVFNENIPKQWWALFHSKPLNELICLGLNNSPTLAAAEAALRQAEENMRAFVGSTMFPYVSALPSAQRERFSAATFGVDPNGGATSPTTVFNLYNVSVNVTYTLDVFGGNRRGIEALGAQVEYQNFLLEAANLTLASNIVTTAITEASLRAQIQATRELILLNETSLKIVKQQFQLGGVSRTDVLLQEGQLANVRATLPPLEKTLALTRHSLSVLIGELPSENQLHKFHLLELTLPTQLPVSLPSCLVRQRPDIRASEALLHAASANIGVAVANMLPQITLNGSYGTEANHWSDLFQGNSAIWSYGAQLLQPIFAGGSLNAKRKAAIAAYDQAAAQYQQTVLQAFQNVADTLRSLELDAVTLKRQTEAETAANASMKLAQQQFRLGAINYLTLLNAENQYQLARINRIQAEALRYADTAALFQALGGGWWNCDVQE